jgi:hypothetical protein
MSSESGNLPRLKLDAVLNLGNQEVIVVECKTHKDRHCDKYTGLKRQLLSYEKLCCQKGLSVRHLLVIANEFSDDFTSECEYDEELSLCFLSARGRLRALARFQGSKRTGFPFQLLL